MEIATSKLLPRAVRVAFIGVFLTFAWVILTVVLGFGATDARADDRDGSGLVGAVVTLVDEGANAMTGTVAGGATEAVSTVVDVVPAPGQAPLSEVTQTAGSVVTLVAEPVADVAAAGAVARPVVDLVATVPVVGAVVTGVGLDDALTDLGASVDGTLAVVADVVSDAGARTGQPPTSRPALPSTIPSPSDDDASVTAVPTTDAATVATAAPAAVSPRAQWFRVATDSASVPAASAQVVSTSNSSASPGGAQYSVAGLLTPAATASSGPTGAGPGAWALAALLPLAAHRAWVRRARPEDEHAPPAPAGSTDVSPD